MLVKVNTLWQYSGISSLLFQTVHSSGYLQTSKQLQNSLHLCVCVLSSRSQTDGFNGCVGQFIELYFQNFLQSEVSYFTMSVLHAFNSVFLVFFRDCLCRLQRSMLIIFHKQINFCIFHVADFELFLFSLLTVSITSIIIIMIVIFNIIIIIPLIFIWL